jgi:hypothetical protein
MRTARIVSTRAAVRQEKIGSRASRRKQATGRQASKTRQASRQGRQVGAELELAADAARQPRNILTCRRSRLACRFHRLTCPRLACRSAACSLLSLTCRRSRLACPRLACRWSRLACRLVRLARQRLLYGTPAVHDGISRGAGSRPIRQAGPRLQIGRVASHPCPAGRPSPMLEEPWDPQWTPTVTPPRRNP